MKAIFDEMSPPFRHLHGFMVPKTSDELQEIVGLMPPDIREKAVGELVAINRQTEEVAIVSKAHDGTWEVDVWRYGEDDPPVQ